MEMKLIIHGTYQPEGMKLIVYLPATSLSSLCLAADSLRSIFRFRYTHLVAEYFQNQAWAGDPLAHRYTVPLIT